LSDGTSRKRGEIIPSPTEKDVNIRIARTVHVLLEMRGTRIHPSVESSVKLKGR